MISQTINETFDTERIEGKWNRTNYLRWFYGYHPNCISNYIINAFNNGIKVSKCLCIMNGKCLYPNNH